MGIFNENTSLRNQLKDANMEAAKGVIVEMLRIGRADEKGNGFYVEDDMVELSTKFIENPTLDNAVELVSKYPTFNNAFQFAKSPIFKNTK